MVTRNSTFKFNLYSAFIISILIPVISISVLFTFYFNFAIKKQNDQNISSILTSVATNITTQLGELKNISTTCYMHRNILNSMESFNNPKLYSYYDSLQLNRLENDYTTAMIKLMFTAQNSIYNISFFPISPSSTSFYSLTKNSAGIKNITLNNYHTLPWFVEALENDGNLIIYPSHIPDYLNNDHIPPVFSGVKLITNLDSKKHVGVLKIDSKLSNLENVLNSIDLNRRNHILIVDEYGNVITSNNTTPTIQSIDYTDSKIQLQGLTYHIHSKSIPMTNWHLVYLTANNHILFYTVYALLISFALMSIWLCVAFIVYRQRSYTMVNSIQDITTTIHQIELGNLNARSYVNANNELKTISEALNRMTERLDEHIQKEYIAVINQQKAEFKALQSQINPHFLYNTLNGFIALNRMGETKKLEKSIISLTHLFRYTCHPADTTTLSNEIEFLQTYLHLQKLKYDERLEFVIQVDPTCLNIELPKLLLQPIVENSIIHGLEPTARTIQINIICNLISIKGIGEALSILITDNGVGYDDTQVQPNSNGIGTQNVKTRVSLFNKESLYYSHSVPNEGTQTLLLFLISPLQERMID